MTSAERQQLLAILSSTPATAKEAGAFQAGAQLLRRGAGAMGGAMGGFMQNRVMPMAARAGLFRTPNIMVRAAPAVTQAAAPVAKATNTAGHLMWNALRGATGFGASANATGLGKVMAGGAAVGTLGGPMFMGAMSGQGRQTPYDHQRGMMVTAGVYTVKGAGLMDIRRRTEEEMTPARKALGMGMAVGGLGLSLRNLHALSKKKNVDHALLAATALLLGSQIATHTTEPRKKQAFLSPATADRARAGVDLASYLALGIPTAARAFAPRFYQQHHALMKGMDYAGLAGLGATSLHSAATGKKPLPDMMDAAGLGLMGMALHRRSQA